MAVTTKDLLKEIKDVDVVNKDMAKIFIGQKTAVLCNRYQYRGILLDVVQDYIVLANAKSVEISGHLGNAEPDQEDDIDGPVLIKLSSVELIYQPNWVNAPLTDEKKTFALLKTK